MQKNYPNPRTTVTALVLILVLGIFSRARADETEYSSAGTITLSARFKNEIFNPTTDSVAALRSVPLFMQISAVEYLADSGTDIADSIWPKAVEVWTTMGVPNLTGQVDFATLKSEVSKLDTIVTEHLELATDGVTPAYLPAYFRDQNRTGDQKAWLMYRLFTGWSPYGKAKADIFEVFGQPTKDEGNQTAYLFEFGTTFYQFEFEFTEDDLVDKFVFDWGAK